MESSFYDNNENLSGYFNNGDVDNILKCFQVDKNKLETEINNDVIIKTKNNSKNKKLKKLLSNLLNDQTEINLKKDTVEIKHKSLLNSVIKSDNLSSIFTIENLTSFSLQKNKKNTLDFLIKKYQEQFYTQSHFTFDSAQATLTQEKINEKITEFRKKLQSAKMNVELSDAEIIALSIYTNENFFRLSNALLNGNIERVNELLKIEVATYNNPDEKIKNKILKECILATLFSISGLSKFSQSEINYTFRGELTLPQFIYNQRKIAANENAPTTTNQQGFLSSNIGKPSHAFNNDLAGSSTTLLIGKIGGGDISNLSLIQQKAQEGAEKEWLYGPTRLSWKHIETPANIPFVFLEPNDPVLIDTKSFPTNLPNTIIYIKGQEKLYFSDASTQELRVINHTSMLEKNLNELIQENLKQDSCILTPNEFKNLFGDITSFRPTKNFFLAIPTSNSNSIFKRINNKLDNQRAQFFSNKTAMLPALTQQEQMKQAIIQKMNDSINKKIIVAQEMYQSDNLIKRIQLYTNLGQDTLNFKGKNIPSYLRETLIEAWANVCTHIQADLASLPNYKDLQSNKDFITIEDNLIRKSKYHIEFSELLNFVKDVTSIQKNHENKWRIGFFENNLNKQIIEDINEELIKLIKQYPENSQSIKNDMIEFIEKEKNKLNPHSNLGNYIDRFLTKQKSIQLKEKHPNQPELDEKKTYSVEKISKFLHRYK